MDKYRQAEKELAELLGWTDVCEYANISGSGAYLEGTIDGCIESYIPQWCSNSAASFDLAIDHRILCPIKHDSVCAASEFGHLYKAYYSDHKDKYQAARYAIVQAVIAKLSRRTS